MHFKFLFNFLDAFIFSEQILSSHKFLKESFRNHTSHDQNNMGERQPDSDFCMVKNKNRSKGPNNV